ncbi:MAG TPA: metallophosphoesterase [Planctomycetota bacterium]|nr:metallophosphoesterase [Planctomycetota bacterium]
MQLSDLHLTARRGGRVWGSDVWANLERTLAHLREELDDIERLVLTGDLANSGSAEAYAQLASVLQPWRDRLRLVPGNHDDRERLRAAFPSLWPGAPSRLRSVERVGDWRFVLLDSLEPGRTLGRLGEEQLGWLREQLEGDAPSVLFVHHPPLRVGCWWLDKDLLRDLRELTAILAPSAVRWIFSGHVHQEQHGRLGQADVWTTPSTAYQYRPRSWLPVPGARTPAFRLIELDEGQVHTRVVRL